jgi:hypothetical protein
MVTPINRLDVFKSNPNITSAIYELQKMRYTDALTGEFESDADKAAYFEMFDAIDLDIEPIEKFNSIISLDHTDVNTFVNALNRRIGSLLASLDVSDLFIISDLKYNIFGALKNNYPPLKKALQKTKKLLPDLRYNEALRIDLQDLPLFIETFFWIERVDPSAPEFIYFADVNCRFAFNICKYGYIHFTEFENEIIDDEVLKPHGLYFADNCDVKFFESKSISGRQSSN